MVDKKQNKSYSVQLNYNLTKRTQHISAMTALIAKKRRFIHTITRVSA